MSPTDLPELEAEERVFRGEYYARGGWHPISPSGNEEFARQELRNFVNNSPHGRDYPVRLVLVVFVLDRGLSDETEFY